MNSISKITIIFLNITIIISPIESQNKSDLESRLSELEDKVKDIESSSDLTDLQKRLDYSKEVIESQDTLFTGISTVFAIFSITLTLLAISLPFLGDSNFLWKKHIA